MAPEHERRGRPPFRAGLATIAIDLDFLGNQPAGRAYVWVMDAEPEPSARARGELSAVVGGRHGLS